LGSLYKAIALWLSQKIVVGEFWFFPRSPSSHLHHIASFDVKVVAMYSNSIVDNVVVVCFLTCPTYGHIC